MMNVNGKPVTRLMPLHQQDTPVLIIQGISRHHFIGNS
ncbi:hypothetical protein ENKOMM257B_24230 [Enterobacter kobei]|jgi:hypothetical protein